MTLEPRIRTEFNLLQVLYRGFTEDFTMAAASPALQYDPDDADPGMPGRERMLAEEPMRYRRQGLYLGQVELLADALLTEDGNRCRTYGEFLAIVQDPSSPAAATIADLQEHFSGFHPLSSPVLWRVLVMQYFQCRLFLQIANGDAGQTGVIDLDDPEPETTASTLEWRPESKYTEMDANEPIRIALCHLKKTIAELSVVRFEKRLSRASSKG